MMVAVQYKRCFKHFQKHDLRLFSCAALPSPAKPRHLNIKLPVGSAKKFWSADETRWLEEGVELYGTGNWAKILKKYNFVGRTSVNLKDKWRNLKKNS